MEPNITSNPPKISKRQAEFWGLIIVLCTATALLILIIDYSIKGEQSGGRT